MREGESKFIPELEKEVNREEIRKKSREEVCTEIYEDVYRGRQDSKSEEELQALSNSLEENNWELAEKSRKAPEIRHQINSDTLMFLRYYDVRKDMLAEKNFNKLIEKFAKWQYPSDPESMKANARENFIKDHRIIGVAGLTGEGEGGTPYGDYLASVLINGVKEEYMERISKIFGDYKVEDLDDRDPNFYVEREKGLLKETLKSLSLRSH